MRWLSVCVGLAWALDAHAQDAPMTGRAGSVVPTHSADVALQSLSVELAFVPEREAFQVKSSFALTNNAKRETRLQLGLAEARCESDSDEDDPCADPSSTRFEEFTTRLRGAELTTRRGRVSPQHEWASALAGVYLFDVRLRPAERAEVEHRYVVPAGPAAGGGMNATCVTRAGSLWAEPIDKATITFLLPVYSCLVVEPEQIARRNRRVVLRDQKPWLQLTFAAQRWTPKGDVSLYFETCVPPRDTELSGCSLLDELTRFAYATTTDGEPSQPIEREALKSKLSKLSEDELGRCGQAVFDAYASYYNASELSALARRPSAKRHYAAPLLTPDDWKWVGLVDEVVAARKTAKPLPPPVPPKKVADGGCSISPNRASPSGAWLLLLLLTAAGFVQVIVRRAQ
jgi:hypothetical protein